MGHHDSNKVKRILFIATVDSHIYYFHLPFMNVLKNMGYEVEVACSDTGFTDNIIQNGFKVYNIPFSRNPLSFLNIKSFFMLLYLMKKRKYIMIHTHTPVSSFLGRIAAKIAAVPHVVYTVHGFHFHEYGGRVKNFVYYRLEKFAGKFTDVLITINKDDFRVANKKKMIPRGRVVYIKGVGVDTNVFNSKRFNEEFKKNYREKLGIMINDFVIIFVAELTREKNVYDMVECLPLIHTDNIKLLIVGDGKLRKNLEIYIARRNLTKQVIFLGRRNDIPELLYISDVFVMTSFREGLPKSMLEAMSMEKPVVAYDIRGVRDLVTNNVNGFLVPFKDVNNLAEKILFLYNNPITKIKMGENGRKIIEREFSSQIIIKRMRDLYLSILGSQ